MICYHRKRMHPRVLLNSILALPVAEFAGGDSEPAAAQESGAAVMVVSGKYRESPMLAQLVANGELPPVDERLPVRPLVLEPLAEAGETVGGYVLILIVAGQSPASRARSAAIGWRRRWRWSACGAST